MNRIVLATLIAVSAVVVAQDAPPAPAKPATHTPRRYRGNPEAGLVSRTVKEGKVFRFIDMRANGSDLKPIIAAMPQSFSFDVDAVRADKAEGCPMTVAMKALGDKVGAAVVIANEGVDKPSLVICPEDAVAVVNIDKLAKDLPAEKADEVLAKRLSKEMWRAAAFVMGGYEVQYPCVMKGVTSLAELDANPLEMTCPPVSGNISKMGDKLGLKKVQCVPYFVAVRQGWAPAPVNDAQKEEVARFEKLRAAKEAVPAATETK